VWNISETPRKALVWSNSNRELVKENHLLMAINN
jgi:hypothetical protein|tara:strand:+ start:1373 stop:1474 length:102 start_codon:yes stop_codon:yes gene_type:complete